jgi:hypothetical protein
LASQAVTAMRKAVVAGVAVLASGLLAACSGQPSPEATVRPTTLSGPDPVAVHISQVTTSRARPVEGAVSYLRVDHVGGATVIDGRLPGSSKVTLRLPAGQYRLHSWQRTCDGNCSHLDQPTLECARAFSLHRGEPLVATIQVDWTSKCTIVLHHQ